MPSPNFSGSPFTTALVDNNGNYIAMPSTNSDGSQSARAVGGPTLVTGQVPVTTSATPVVPARAGRMSVTLSSTSAVVFYVGPSGVTTANGLYVSGVAGASVTLQTQAAVFAVGAGAVTISYAENF